MRIKFLLPLLAALAIPAAHAADAVGIAVSGCWIRSLPDNAAAYFTVDNNGDKPQKLVGIDMQDYDMAMLHETIKVGGMMKMQEVDAAEVPAHGNLRLIPGSYHVMLMDAKKAPAIGGTLNMTLHFEGDTTASASCTVKGPDAMAAN